MRQALVDFIQSELATGADPAEAPAMKAYMKSSIPFLGVKSPIRKAILREAKAQWKPESEAELQAWIAALWSLPHREEKYMAIALARAFQRHLGLDSLPLFERMIREGAWWDFVDDIAANLTGFLWKKNRVALDPVMDAWIEDEHLWIRRTAIIGQLKHREELDEARLFRYCRQTAHEKDFFIRKAIGWALRDHAKQAPEEVLTFLEKHRDAWSGLSYREATKHLRS